MALIDALERRSHPSNPDAWLINGYSGRETKSGVRVDEDSALSATAVWAGVRTIAETLAMLSLKLKERIDDRTKRDARRMDLFRVLHDEPNEEQTSFEFREMQQGFVLTWGNCYAQKLYNGRGEVTELWPLVPWRVTPIRSRNNTLLYRVRLPDDSGQTETLSADDVLHIRGFSSNGILGDNVVERFRNSIGLALASEEYGGLFFGEGLNAGGVITHPSSLGEKAGKNLRESLKGQAGGIGKAHRLLILEEGMKWQQTTVDPEKAQALETRKFQVTEVARILNLPPHLLKDLEHATFSNIEHQGQEFVTYCLQPWLTRWEQRLNKSLLLPSQRSKFFTQFEIKSLLRGDTAARTAFYNTMFQNAVYSPNHILELEDEEPFEGGDQRFIQGAMVPIDKIGEIVAAQIEAKKTPPPAPPADPQFTDPPSEPRSIRPDPFTALEPVVRAEFDRIVRRQAKAVRAALKKGSQEFRVWADEFFEKEAAIVTDSIGPALRSLSALTGNAYDARAFAQLDTDVALSQLRSALKTPERLDDAVAGVVDEWEKSRSVAVTNQIMQRRAAA